MQREAADFGDPAAPPALTAETRLRHGAERVIGRYTATQRPCDAKPAADYVYDVFRDGAHVAVFRHTFRGDEWVLQGDGLAAVQLDASILRGDILGLEVSAGGEAILDRALDG